MNIITVLLCALATQVTSQTYDIFPARILAQQTTLSENSDLYVTCSTFGLKKQTMVNVYLCKDNFGIKEKMQKRDQYDTTFIINRVGLHHSGNYSCVYTTRNDSLIKVAMRGRNILQIVVIANFLPADISVAGPSTVTEGVNVKFRCTISETLQTLSQCQLIHSYLRRNETVLQVQAFSVTQKEATFTIEGAVMRDSGHYSCVVLPSKCIQEHEKALYGKNAILLEVKGSRFLVIYFSGVITLMLFLCLCLCWIIKRAGYLTLCNPRAASQKANTDMLEEQQEQTEGEDLEANDGESFSSEEQEDVAAEDSTFSDDCEGVYCIAENESGDEYDDTGQMYANRHILSAKDDTHLYARSIKWKKQQIQPVPDFNFT